MLRPRSEPAFLSLGGRLAVLHSTEVDFLSARAEASQGVKWPPGVQTGGRRLNRPPGLARGFFLARFQRFRLRGGARRPFDRRLFLRRCAAPRRDRTVARRQDGVPDRARQQSDRGRAPAGAGRLRRGAHHAGAARAATGRRGAALRLRGASARASRDPIAAGRNRPAASPSSGSRSSSRALPAGARGARPSRSISSTIPANGCSTCRCSTKATRNGRARRWRQARPPARAPLSEQWRAALVGLDPAGPGRRGRGPAHRRIVHRLSQAGARRRLCALDLAARPVPDARRSRRLARADLRADSAERRRDDRSRLARGDDGAPLRGL